MKTVAILGCGNLGQAIAEGLIDSSTDYQITATRRNLKAIQYLADKGVTTTSDNRAAVQGADIIVVAVKPYNVEEILKEVGDLIASGALLVSVATGVSIESMKSHVTPGVLVYRAMPNTAAAVKESITTVCYEDSAAVLGIAL